MPPATPTRPPPFTPFKTPFTPYVTVDDATYGDGDEEATGDVDDTHGDSEDDSSDSNSLGLGGVFSEIQSYLPPPIARVVLPMLSSRGAHPTPSTEILDLLPTPRTGVVRGIFAARAAASLRESLRSPRARHAEADSDESEDPCAAAASALPQRFDPCASVASALPPPFDPCAFVQRVMAAAAEAARAAAEAARVAVEKAEEARLAAAQAHAERVLAERAQAQQRALAAWSEAEERAEAERFAAARAAEAEHFAKLQAAQSERSPSDLSMAQRAALGAAQRERAAAGSQTRILGQLGSPAGLGSGSGASGASGGMQRCSSCAKPLLRSQRFEANGKFYCAAHKPASPPAAAPTGITISKQFAAPPSTEFQPHAFHFEPQPAPREPYLTATHVTYTHPGGSKPANAKNQDTWFTLRVDEHNFVFGVLDGHGAENGRLVADAAAGAIKAHVAAHFESLRTEPQAVFNGAFEAAHEAARRAVLETDENLKLSASGVPVDEWEDENGISRQEAADGGTTATIAVLLDGATLLLAQVGDSSALFGGTRPAAAAAAAAAASGKPDSAESLSFELLVQEHSATNPSEYARIVGSGPRGALVHWVYETPGALEDGTAPRVWRPADQWADASSPEIDEEALALAHELGTPVKNVRGELPALLHTPMGDPDHAEMEPQSLAVTRALGDFYMHTFGVTWMPEVVSIDLGVKAAELSALTLVLASDGVWDLWEGPEAFRMVARAPKGWGTKPNASPPTTQAHAFFKACVAKGEECFGNLADNLTGIVVYLHPPGVGAALGAAPPPAPAPAPAPAAPAIEEAQEDWGA